MGDWIGLGVFFLVVVGALVGLSFLGKPPKRISTKEFERRVQGGPGMMSAGIIGLQKILEPGAEKAAAVRQDLRAGHYDDKQGVGEGDEPGPAGAGQKPAGEGEEDA